jgi:hypothetical protein
MYGLLVGFAGWLGYCGIAIGDGLALARRSSG